MAFTHRVGITYSAGEGQIASGTSTYAADCECGFDGTIAKDTTNAEVDVAIDVSALVTLCLSSDSTVTLKTNSSSSPGNTLTLTGGKPLVWTNDDPAGAACPLTVDVTKLYLTNGSSTADAKVRLRWLVDATP